MTLTSIAAVFAGSFLMGYGIMPAQDCQYTVEQQPASNSGGSVQVYRWLDANGAGRSLDPTALPVGCVLEYASDPRGAEEPGAP